jgi:hypothetical protein
MAKLSNPLLALLAALLAALLLAGCSGGVDTDDTDGDGDSDEIEGGGQVDDDDGGDEDAPGLGLLATVAVLGGVGAFLMRRRSK